MEISGIANLATSVAETGTKREVDIAILKKTMDIAASSATALIEAIPATPSANLPSNLGKNINTTA